MLVRALPVAQWRAGVAPSAARRAFPVVRSTAAPARSPTVALNAGSYVHEPVALRTGPWGDSLAPRPATLSLKVASPETAKGLVHRYVVAVRRGFRAGSASTLTRGEVRGGGRKPYAQKGTGQARRGSSRSPLIRGGGVIFGPKPRDWSVKMNRREKRLALSTALQSAAADMVVVPALCMAETGTRELVRRLEALELWPSEDRILMLTGEPRFAEHTWLSARNVADLTLNTTAAPRVYDLLNADRIVLDEAALGALHAAYGAEGWGWMGVAAKQRLKRSGTGEWEEEEGEEGGEEDEDEDEDEDGEGDE